ncbi:carbohydrate ABC transporter permease [Breznakiella homolactica]|uniref:Sugar ABC transporter permease n=1 Tax=Breznakiella homolactica TaxID=2798577 RepID=A0A7T7XPJ9_9SPIR|nr:sugar ABC transporter permease [Breznakiella homolactica]QQO10171.1 sugar ABC transporter permease [Breznakiella homolactica]
MFLQKSNTNGLSLKDKEIRRFRWAMLAPGIIVLFSINLLPILDTLRTSLYDYYLPAPDKRHFIGLGNYIALFRDQRFLLAFLRTIIFMVTVVAAETVFGLIIAIYLTSKIKGSKFLRAMFLLPIILTPIATAFMWRIMYSPTLGVLNYFLSLVNIPPQTWVYSETQALMSVALVLIWCKSPFMIMMFYTGLLAVSDDVIDASKIDGANAWQQFWKVKLPLIKPLFFVAILFQAIDSAKEFDLSFILTRGGPGTASETLSVYTYTNSFTFLKMGYGSASAIVMSAFIALTAVLIIKTGGINFDDSK